MQKSRFIRYGSAVAAVALLLVAPAVVRAASTSSSNYLLDETSFGAGSSLNDCSDTYCAKTSIGDTAVGSASSDSYAAQFGANTTTMPYIEIRITGGSHDLGVLTTDTTAKAAFGVQVRNYLSGGYTMQITGPPPTTSNHPLAALGSPSTSQPGMEQFGVNLAANTTPAVGAAPVQVPSSEMAFGTATADYSSPNLFKYVDGDIIASSPRDSGETDYTISFIVNISNVTPGGQYKGSLSAVVVPVY